MGQYRDTPSPADQPDHLHRRHPQAGHIRRPIPANVVLKGLQNGGDIPPVDHCAGNVQPSDGAAPVSESGDLFPIQGHPQGCQFFQHLPGAMEPGGPHRGQRLVQRPVPGVYI
jgi:hypothetical protein